MAKILEMALRAVRSTQTVDALIVQTSYDVVYRIPKMADGLKVEEVVDEGDFLYVRCLKTEKICPVAKSPLDAFRGRGLHSSKKTIS
jgi:hypothetical protein